MGRVVPESARLEAYRFDFPEKLVAAAPVSPRDSSRLLVLRRETGSVEHGRFRDLPEHLEPGDLLVLNRTKVLPARLRARKATGGKVELLLLRETEAGVWTALSSDLKAGAEVRFGEGVSAAVERLTADGEWVLRFRGDAASLMYRSGLAPLPPYILKRRKSSSLDGDGVEDRDRYQTVYARETGSVAAPTAGLHFTPELLDRLRDSGVRVAEIILHVGPGTFRPVTAPDIRDHSMLPERFEIPAETSAKLTRARRDGGRIVAVGTTTVRTLETAALSSPGPETDLFIYPGHRFRSVDAFITNFHQPASTPLLLTSAFAGRERLLAAYREAVEHGYRLFSYGDSMLIL